MAEKRDKIIIYNTDLENNVTENLTLEDGELALVREKDKERLYIKNTAGVVIPIHNILDGGEIELPTIQSEWIDAGLAWWVGNTSLKNQVRFDSSLQGAFVPPLVTDIDRLTSMNNMFSQCTRLTSLDLSNFNTSKVTTMYTMFQNCSGLTSLNVSNFNTSNVTTMNGIFLGCSGLTSLDVSNFVTTAMTKMYGMFQGCSGLTSLDVSNFNTSKVTEMSWMFLGCSGLTSLDLSNWNTSKVTTMSFMFSGCTSLKSLDLSNFNTSNVTDMSYMFDGCTSLQTIKCTEATKQKFIEYASENYLPTAFQDPNFNGWVIV